MEVIIVSIGNLCNAFGQPIINTLQILFVTVVTNIVISEKPQVC